MDLSQDNTLTCSPHTWLLVTTDLSGCNHFVVSAPEHLPVLYYLLPGLIPKVSQPATKGNQTKKFIDGYKSEVLALKSPGHKNSCYLLQIQYTSFCL